MGSIELNGFIDFTSMLKSIVQEMVNMGFSVTNVDGAFSSNISNLTEKVILKPSIEIDSISGSQPWVVALIFNETQQWVDFYITGPEQIIDADGDFRVARKKVDEADQWLSGKLTDKGKHSDDEGYFRSLSFENWEIPQSDTQANPMSYRLTVSDHGFSLFIWVESYDSSGQKFFWVCTQRMVDYDGVPVTTGKAPLFCLFANQGYPDDVDGDLTPNVRSIFKFVVREQDVNSPTFPVSAVEDSADSSRILNIAQQVSLRENNSVVLYFPNNLNTQRYAYPHQLDMIGVISADVVSQSTDLVVNTFGEQTDRTYRGMNADQLDNKGARVMFWIGGGSLEN